MSFHYNTNRQDFLLQQIEGFFKHLRERWASMGKNEGKLPISYFDDLYETEFHAERDFFINASSKEVISHLHSIEFSVGLELVARLLYETGLITDDSDAYFRKASALYAEHLAQGHSISLENIAVYSHLQTLGLGPIA
jgi:hypothetical protein